MIAYSFKPGLAACDELLAAKSLVLDNCREQFLWLWVIADPFFFEVLYPRRRTQRYIVRPQ